MSLFWLWDRQPSNTAADNSLHLFKHKLPLTSRVDCGPGWVLSWLEHQPKYAQVAGSAAVRHIQESTNECINKWNNKSLSLSQINK